MVVMAEWMYYFWWLGTGFAVGVMVLLTWMYDRQRKAHGREMRAMAADHSEMFEILSASIPHVCRPPSFGRKDDDGAWIRPELGSHWLCMCGVRYVLMAYGRPTELAPFRLGWITEWESRHGWRPAWDRQDPGARFKPRSPLDPPSLSGVLP